MVYQPEGVETNLNLGDEMGRLGALFAQEKAFIQQLNGVRSEMVTIKARLQKEHIVVDHTAPEISA